MAWVCPCRNVNADAWCRCWWCFHYRDNYDTVPPLGERECEPPRPVRLVNGDKGVMARMLDWVNGEDGDGKEGE